MRRALVCLVVSGLSVLVIWGCEDYFGFDDDEAQTKKGKLKRKDFRFVKGGRRDPFDPLFKKPPPPSSIEKFRPEDLPRATLMLADIRTEFQQFRRNPSPHRANQLHKNVDKLEAFLRKPCDHPQTKIHVAELRRRTRNHHALIDQILRDHSAAVHVAQVEIWLDKADKLADKEKADEAEQLLSQAEPVLRTAKVGPAMSAAKKQAFERKLEIIREKIRPLRFVGGIKGAKEALSLMRLKLQLHDFEAVLTTYPAFRKAIREAPGPYNNNERQQIDHLTSRAKDIYRQARLGLAKRKLDEIEATLSQAESCLLCDEFESSIEHANDAVQSLRVLKVPPSMEPRKNQLARRARDLARRASIRKEFLQHPPAIAGVGFEPGNSVVLVNDKIVQEGDYFDTQTRVKIIASAYVVFTYKGEDIRVSSGL